MKNHGENNQKANQTISQAPALGPKHDKIRAQWVLNILSKSMLRDSNQFHHFEDGVCFCIDYW
jgi:hypothetical protein